MTNKVIIVDTEYTTWEGAMEADWAEPWQHRELVQIAAIKLDLIAKAEIEACDILVKPTINPILSDYFVELTAITQAQVDEQGTAYPKALDAFVHFCAGFAPSHIVSYGADDQILVENCALNDMPYPFNAPWADLRLALRESGFDDAQYNSGNLHELTDTKLHGHTHNALHDVRSIAAYLFYRMKQAREKTAPPLHLPCLTNPQKR